MEGWNDLNAGIEPTLIERLLNKAKRLLVKAVITGVLYSLASCSAPRPNVNGHHYRSMLEREHQFSVRDSQGAEHIVEELTIREYKHYKKAGLKPVDAFAGSDFRVYTTPGGKVVVEDQHGYVLYPSLQVLQDVVNYAAEHPARQLMYNRNSFGDQFPMKADSLISSMLLDFKIDVTAKTDSEILRAVDKVLVKKRT